jgi:hypothetical protein
MTPDAMSIDKGGAPAAAKCVDWHKLLKTHDCAGRRIPFHNLNAIPPC